MNSYHRFRDYLEHKKQHHIIDKQEEKNIEYWIQSIKNNIIHENITDKPIHDEHFISMILAFDNLSFVPFLEKRISRINKEHLLKKIIYFESIQFYVYFIKKQYFTPGQLLYFVPTMIVEYSSFNFLEFIIAYHHTSYYRTININIFAGYTLEHAAISKKSLKIFEILVKYRKTGKIIKDTKHDNMILSIMYDYGFIDGIHYCLKNGYDLHVQIACYNTYFLYNIKNQKNDNTFEMLKIIYYHLVYTQNPIIYDQISQFIIRSFKTKKVISTNIKHFLIFLFQKKEFNMITFIDNKLNDEKYHEITQFIGDAYQIYQYNTPIRR